MKKIAVVLVFLVVMGCSAQKDPVEKYVKEDIVLEVGSKVTINEIVDLEKVDNEELKKSLEKAQLEIDYKNNNLIDEEISNDKVFATNNIVVKYEYNKKEYESDIEIKLKDTKKPSVKIGNNYVFAVLDQKKNEESFIKELKLKISDNGSYNTEIENYNKVDFSKVGEHKLKLIVRDEANNIVEKDVYLFVGKDNITYNYQLIRKDLKKGLINYNLTFPSYITSYYTITEKKKKKLDDYNKGAFTQNFILKNGKSSIDISVVSGLPMDWNGELLANYKINNHTVIIDETYYDENGKKSKVEYYSSIINEGSGWLVINIGTKNISYDELKRVTDLIAANSYEY